MFLENDDMGFSFHRTTIQAGAVFHVHYKNHLESVYGIYELAVEEIET